MPASNRWGGRRPTLLIALIFFALAAYYSLTTPLFESPDELWHYPFVWHLARTGQLPVQEPANPQLWQQEGSQPPLYYALAALLTAALPADDLPELIYPNPHAAIGLVSPDGNANIVVHTAREAWPWRGAVLAMRLVRLFSVLLATGTVVTVCFLGRLLWPGRPRFALLAAAFVAFNPMFLFISGSINNDNLITLLAALTLWRLVHLVQQNPVDTPLLWPAIQLGLLGGLAALAKVSGLGLVGLSGLTLLGLGLQRRASLRAALLPAAVSGLLTLLLAGWWYWRNYQLYSDWTGTEIMVTMMGARPVSPTLAQLLAEAPGLARSFWGLFGYFSVPMPASLYAFFFALSLAGAGGWLLILAGRRPLPPGLRQAGPILLGWLLIMLAGFVQWTLRTPATQGRLLFPALAAVAPLWAAGWLALMPRRFPWLRWLELSPLPLMLTVALWVPGGVIAPAYARPVPLSRLPAAAQPLDDVTFGDTATLLGYTLPQTTVRPGNWLPLTLYWRGEQPTTTDYSLFVHLLDEQNLIVAQRDSFHGSGLFPTSQWPPGVQFGNTYVLRLPYTAYAPAQARLAVGLYDRHSGQRLTTAAGLDAVTFGHIQINPRAGENPNPQRLQFDDGVDLAGYALDRRQAAPGQTVTLTLYWQARTQPSQNYKVFVHLVDAQNNRVAQHDSDPQQGAAPTGSWQPGQTIVDAHPLTLSGEAPPGAYSLTVGLYDAGTGQRLSLLKNHEAWVQANAVTLSNVRVTAGQ